MVYKIIIIIINCINYTLIDTPTKDLYKVKSEISPTKYDRTHEMPPPPEFKEEILNDKEELNNKESKKDMNDNMDKENKKDKNGVNGNYNNFFNPNDLKVSEVELKSKEKINDDDILPD